MTITKPAQVTEPLWWFVEQTCALTSTPFVDEYGGTINSAESGSHNTRDNLLANPKWKNDYSIRDQFNKEGPGDKCAAYDWTFPSAQRGNWTEIGAYSLRIQNAWNNRDPRTYGLFEVLCQTPEDRQPEGFVFYPNHVFRVPDPSHEWHMHFGFVRKYLNDWNFFGGLLEVIKGVALPPKPPGNLGSRELKWIQPNMTGTDVSFVQKYIGVAHCGAADGVFGGQTDKGVRWYQNMRGIQVDGIVGPDTWRNMGVLV